MAARGVGKVREGLLREGKGREGKEGGRNTRSGTEVDDGWMDGWKVRDRDERDIQTNREKVNSRKGKPINGYERMKGEGCLSIIYSWLFIHLCVHFIT